MLVITRKIGEGLQIGDTTIEVSAIINDRVRIAIDAPENVTVLRQELGPWRESKAADGGKGAA